MDEDQATALQQLVIWKDKYHRLAEQHATSLNQNQELEDRLINVVDKIERDKSLLSDEIDHLADKLACASNTIDHMKNECARYKSDCMLAVHLLQCQPSFYTSQHLSSMLPLGVIDLWETDQALMRKIVHFSTSAMTFPPTAVFMQSEELTVDEAPPDEPESRNDVRDVFVKKILMAPEYQTEKLVQCPKCGFAVVKYDRCTQTISDSYLSNSRSAPHLIALDDESESEQQNSRKRRSTTTSGGDLLIDLSDDDHASPFASITLEGSTNPMAAPAQRQQQVQFNMSPGVHNRRSPNSDSMSKQQADDPYSQKASVTEGGQGKYKQAQRQGFTSIPISDDG